MSGGISAHLHGISLFYIKRDATVPQTLSLSLSLYTFRNLGGVSSVLIGSKMALEKAKEIVSSNSVAVFSKTYCSFCVKVKKLFTDLEATFKVVELDVESDGSEIQSALAQWTGQRTVPNVFIGGKHIGGCDDTVALHGEEKLVPLLTAAGALAATKVTA